MNCDPRQQSHPFGHPVPANSPQAAPLRLESQAGPKNWQATGVAGGKLKGL